MMLDLEAIAAVDDLARETVDVPEWGGTVELRELTLAERLQVAKMATDAPERLPAWLVAHSLTAPADLATADLAATESMLAGKGKALERLAQKVLELSGLGADEADDAAKN